MKYEHINYKDRSYIGKYWNKQYLQNVKSILNVTKGVFGGNRSFFEKAFGKNVGEYHKILSMPKDLVTYRIYFEENGITQKWEKLFEELSPEERYELLELVPKGFLNLVMRK